MVGLLWTERREVEAREADRLQVQARVVDDSLVRQLRGVNAALVGMRDEVQALRPEADPANLANRLRLLTRAMPGVRTMLVLDREGMVVATSRDELIGRDLRERPYFIVPSRSPDPATLYVSRPFRSSVGGLVVNVSHVFLRADGGFGGVVTATLDPDYFDVVLRSVLYAPDMRATLVHGGGRLFMDMPPNPATLDRDVARPGTVFSMHRDGGRPTSLLSGLVTSGGENRLVATRTVSRPELKMDQPIVAMVSRDAAAPYRGWRECAFEYAVFYSLFAIGCAVALRVLQRRRLAFDRLAADAARERARSARELRQITDAVPALISYIDRDQRFRFANDAYREWLGVDPRSMLGRSLREFHGDDAYALFRHHVEAALAGQRVEYEREVETAQGPRWVHVTAVPQRDEQGVVQGLYLLNQDLTARRAAELRSARSEERLSLALEGSGQALFDWDIVADRIYQSAQMPTLLGEPAAERVVGVGELLASMHPDDVEVARSAFDAVVSGESSAFHVEYRLRGTGWPEGEWHWVLARGRVVERTAEGRALRLAGTCADVHQRKLLEAKLRQQAELDSLTGLPNRALFHDRLQQAMLRAQRGDTAVALLFIDIDHFKQVNDTFGHEAGDGLLKEFARRLQQSARKSDTVARLGGDEFTVILERLRDMDDARRFAVKVVEVARLPMDIGGRSILVSASVGVALSRPNDADAAGLLRRADAALYEAKRRGRDGFCVDGESGHHDDEAAPRA